MRVIGITDQVWRSGTPGYDRGDMFNRLFKTRPMPMLWPPFSCLLTLLGIGLTLGMPTGLAVPLVVNKILLGDILLVGLCFVTRDTWERKPKLMRPTAWLFWVSSISTSLGVLGYGLPIFFGGSWLLWTIFSISLLTNGWMSWDAWHIWQFRRIHHC